MVLALGILFNNWLYVWNLRATRTWSIGEICLSFLMAMIQYFTCSLASVEVKDSDREIDVNAWFRKQRVPILGAFAVLSATAMLTNYAHRKIAGGGDWFVADLALLPVLLFIIAAMLFEPR